MLSIQIQNGYINGCDNKPCRYTHISYSTWYIPNASPSPSHLSYPTAGWKQEILRWNAGNFIFFTSWKRFFVLKFAINKRSVGSQKCSVKTNCLIFENPAWVPTNPSAAAESTTPPPLLSRIFRAFQRFLWWKPQGKPTNCPSNERIQAAEEQPFWPEFRVTTKKISTDHLDEFWMLQKKWIIMNPNISPIRNLPPINCVYIYIKKAVLSISP